MHVFCFYVLCFLFSSYNILKADIFNYTRLAFELSNPHYLGSSRFATLSNYVALGGDIYSGFFNPAGLAFKINKELTVSNAFAINQSIYKLMDLNHNPYSNQRFQTNSNNWDIAHAGMVFNQVPIKIYPQLIHYGILNIAIAVQYVPHKTNNKQIAFDNVALNDIAIVESYFQPIDKLLSNGSENTKQERLDQILMGDNIFATLIENNHLFINDNAEIKAPEFSNSKLEQLRIQETTKSNDYNIAIATNLYNKYFIGFSLYYRDGTSERSFSVQESGHFIHSNTTGSYIQNWNSASSLSFQSSLYFNLGFIYNISPAIRIGLSYLSASKLKIKFNQTITVKSSESVPLSLNPSLNFIPQFNSFQWASNRDFVLTTPSTFRAGFSFFFKKLGFFTSQVEYRDYKNIEYKNLYGSNIEGLDAIVGEHINLQYLNVFNFSSAIEILFYRMQFRVSYKYFPPYFSTEKKKIGLQEQFSFGLSYRPNAKWVFDIGYLLRMSEERIDIIATLPGNNYILSDNKYHNIIFGLTYMLN